MALFGGSKKKAAAPTKGQEKLGIKVFSPYQVFYQGTGNAISAVNKTGPFDVLLDHANFFTLLTKGNVEVDTGYQQFKFPIQRGVMKVTDNKVTVFVDV